MTEAESGYKVAHGTEFDAPAAIAFLESEARTLRWALANASEAGVDQYVLRSQEVAHESWLALIGSVTQSEHVELAEQILTLYGFHGWVCGRLERGFTAVVEHELQERLRALWVTRLCRLTRSTIEGIGSRRDDAPASRPERPHCK